MGGRCHGGRGPDTPLGPTHTRDCRTPSAALYRRRLSNVITAAAVPDHTPASATSLYSLLGPGHGQTIIAHHRLLCRPPPS